MKQEELTPFKQTPSPENTEGAIEVLPETFEAGQEEFAPEKAVEVISNETEQAVTEEDVRLETGMKNLGFSGEEVEALKQETRIGEELKANTEEIHTLGDEAMDKLKAGLRVLGVTLPIAMGQGNALAQNTFEASHLNREVATEEVQAEKVKMLELKSFGGQEKISSEEWKILEKYHLNALWGKNEMLNTYGILPDGRIVEVPGETVGGPAGSYKQTNKGIEFIPQIQPALLEKTYPQAKAVFLHQHPINVYENVVRDIGLSGIVLLDTKIEDIREKKTFSAWPPSYPDIINAVSYPDTINKVVDANGVWTFGVDKDSPVGKGLLARMNTETGILDSALKKQGLDYSDFEKIQQDIAKDGLEKTTEKEPEDTKGVIQATTEGVETTSLWFTGDKNPYEYETHQLNVAVTTPDRKEWEKKIIDFISYCNKQGLRVTYTPFDQQQENANNPVTLSPDMTSSQIDQVAKDAVRNFEQVHE